MTTWQFIAVRAVTPFGFTWQWQNQNDKTVVTSVPFDFYFDCILDARDNGYAGALPAGVKVPFPRLPDVTPGLKVMAALAPKAKPAKLAMTVRALTAAPQKRRASRHATN
ncbi:MAG TPA: hypothetical protein VM164_04845 [Burkholderiales bacterium]|nr:hypothetical protein [Burkholderiales bacterium]